MYIDNLYDDLYNIIAILITISVIYNSINLVLFAAVYIPHVNKVKSEIIHIFELCRLIPIVLINRILKNGTTDLNLGPTDTKN